MNTRIRRVLLRHRRAIVIVTQLALVVFSNWLAFALRFDNNPPPWATAAFREMLPWLVAIRALTFVPFRLYAGFWRYTSLWDMRNIAVAVLTSTALFYPVTLSPLASHAYPRSIFILDSMALVMLLGAVRMARSIYRDLLAAPREKRVLIYGAGGAGELIVRDMKNNAAYQYQPVGFIDDDPHKRGLRMHGVPVLGSREDLPRILKQARPHEILIAIPRAEAGVVRQIVRALEPFRIRISTLPNLRDILDGRVEVSQIRGLAPEDLLNRAPIGLDLEPVRRLIRGRRVMVTGAGGSIGSELCRQIAALGPASLILFERYENSLYSIVNDLVDAELAAMIVPAIGDVTDHARVAGVLATHRPEIIFHAAAHKHVPLMEQNPCEAVKNNVFGTRLMAEMAERYGADRFIFISTDKAVNPTSVMGATKRIAEMLVHAQADGSGTSFFTVRFGNVLGSNGSVIPRFVDQIRKGGPVTITHPEIRRFFMLIPEAVQLVLHAAALGNPGETYVLEMGEQVKVVDIARNLIRLSGLRPDEDIRIEYVGLRPGEKLYEELVAEDEVIVPSGLDKIVRVSARRSPSGDSLLQDVVALETAAWDGHQYAVVRQMAALVPEYGRNIGVRTSPACPSVPTDDEPALVDHAAGVAVDLDLALLDAATARPAASVVAFSPRNLNRA